jgi:16S rRNA (uracil1498-N3)-methyltransferase
VITLLVDMTQLEVGGENEGRFEVQGAAYRHLFRARRLARGVTLRLVDGAGRARWGEVTEVEHRQAVVIAGGEAPTHEPEYSLELLVAAPRSERASWLVEKATELGVTAIRFLASERTTQEYREATLERLDRVARAAVEQCHRSRLPEVSGVHAWAEVPALLSRVRDRWLLDPEARQGASTPKADTRDAGSGAVLIGPEGGWSEAEKEEVVGLGARPMTLGSRILRVETAAVVAAARILLRSEF